MLRYKWHGEELVSREEMASQLHLRLQGGVQRRLALRWVWKVGLVCQKWGKKDIVGRRNHMNKAWGCKIPWQFGEIVSCSILLLCLGPEADTRWWSQIYTTESTFFWSIFFVAGVLFTLHSRIMDKLNVDWGWCSNNERIYMMMAKNIVRWKKDCAWNPPESVTGNGVV